MGATAGTGRARAFCPRSARRAAAVARSDLHIPVVADYAVLEPVIAKALTGAPRRPFVIEGYGNVTARFDTITVYGTGEGRIAVGGSFSAASDLPLIGKASGMIWLTARARQYRRIAHGALCRGRGSRAKPT